RGPPQPPGRGGASAALAKYGPAFLKPAADGYYVGTAAQGPVTKIDVVFWSDPFSAASLQTLHDVRRLLDEQLRAAPGYALFGVTAIMDDVAHVHATDALVV